jgi:hypothetical protein
VLRNKSEADGRKVEKKVKITTSDRRKERKRIWKEMTDREHEEERCSEKGWIDLLDTVERVGKEYECENKKKTGRFKDERMKEINTERKDEKIKRNEKNSG